MLSKQMKQDAAVGRAVIALLNTIGEANIQHSKDGTYAVLTLDAIIIGEGNTPLEAMTAALNSNDIKVYIPGYEEWLKKDDAVLRAAGLGEEGR